MSKLTISTFSTGIAALAMAVACSRAISTSVAPQDAAGASPLLDVVAIDRAEDVRRPDPILPSAAQSRDSSLRRRAARAYARILDADATPLLRALEDEDDETIAWAAYGLGESCKAHEENRVRALGARLASLEPRRAPSNRIDARLAIERALGRCGGDLAEQTLRAWLQRASEPVETAEAAAYALGEVAASRGALARETQVVLLDAAAGTPPLAAALYPFGRAKSIAHPDLVGRLLTVARATLRRAARNRIFAVRAVEQGDDGTQAPVLARVVTSDEFDPAERSEAARALAHLGLPGQSALGEALATLAPVAPGCLAGDGFGILLAAVQAVADGPPDVMDSRLRAIARVRPPQGAPARMIRRASALRCAAAAKLARHAWDAEILQSCDLAEGEAGERARISVLDRSPLTRERRSAWLELARQSRHVRVRENAVELIASHPELGDSGRSVLAEALAASAPGVVTAAARVVAAHPSRAFSDETGREIDPRVAISLRTAIAHRWPEHLIETRVALLDAGLAIDPDGARAYADAACHDVNATMRARAARALSMAGDKNANCPLPAASAEPAPEIGHALVNPVRVVFETEAGPLGVRFDPTLAPVSVTRLVALARSGFYTTVAIHRVVPGFIVQLGDPDGDGYGGSGSLLRCETSPVPFAPLDVGLALAGRDTGSSQIFVTLARYPHLDGQYTWVGHADGDWNAVAEDDLIQAVRIEE